MSEIISEELYLQYKERYQAHVAWLEERKYAPYKPEDHPDMPQSPNEERAAIEVYEWHKDPPQKYFLYIDEKQMLATNWTGAVLGKVAYTSHLSGIVTKRGIVVAGTNGVLYKGMYYCGAGDYARIKRAKNQGEWRHLQGENQ